MIPAPVFVTESSLTAMGDADYSQEIVINNCDSVSVTAGALPSDLTITKTANGALLSGMLYGSTSVITATFTLTATNSTGSTSKEYTIRILPMNG